MEQEPWYLNTWLWISGTWLVIMTAIWVASNLLGVDPGFVLGGGILALYLEDQFKGLDS